MRNLYSREMLEIVYGFVRCFLDLKGSIISIKNRSSIRLIERQFYFMEMRTN